jgi:bacteriocin biosynthesis cyclodehydratase domain-containing protein
VLADAHHPRVPRLFDGRMHDGPHLHVAARGASGVAGPLVIPGHTSCLRCAHLHECDRDSAWPLLSIQWAQSPTAAVDPLLIRAVATHAVVMARRFVDGDPLVDAALVIDPSDAAGKLHARPPHPMCGCRWPDADPVTSRTPGPVMR